MTQATCMRKALTACTMRVFLAKARHEGRIVLTHDLDFGDLMAASQAQLPSVVIFRLRNMSADHLNRYLEMILANYQERLVAGVVLSVTEREIRARSLPIGK